MIGKLNCFVLCLVTRMCMCPPPPLPPLPPPLPLLPLLFGSLASLPPLSNALAGLRG